MVVNDSPIPTPPTTVSAPVDVEIEPAVLVILTIPPFQRSPALPSPPALIRLPVVGDVLTAVPVNPIDAKLGEALVDNNYGDVPSDESICACVSIPISVRPV